MKQSSFFGFDIILFTATLAMMIVGILFVYSSGVTATGEIYSSEYIEQIVWASSGLIILLALSVSNYSYLRYFSLYIYLFCLGLLFFTLLIGREVNGARSWIGIGRFGIQPSEFSKIATILLLANYCVFAGRRIKKLTFFMLGAAICLAPMLIIMAQPDMGTALVYGPIFLIVAFLGGARVRHLSFVVISGIVILLFSILPSFERYILGSEFPVLGALSDVRVVLFFLGALLIIILVSFWGYTVTKKAYFYWVLYVAMILFASILASLAVRRILRDYQIMRLIVFLDPYIEPRGAGWNIIQSITAIGSGGFLGKGFLMGTQSHYNYLPQQSTDFIFSILAEEWGFVGGVIIVMLFLTILLRGIRIITYAKDSFAVLAGAGIIAMLLFHILVNIGMTMGIMPVTGIPLFFLSSGGSSLWTASIGIGVLLNIYMRRYRN